MATRKILRVAISNTCIRFFLGISQVIFTLKLGIIQTLGRMVNLHCRYYPSLSFCQSYAIFENSTCLQQWSHSLSSRKQTMNEICTIFSISVHPCFVNGVCDNFATERSLSVKSRFIIKCGIMLNWNGQNIERWS
jgi:hypothetical protein